MDLDLVKKQFTWVRRQTWMEDLSVASAEQFVDACMLAGTDLIEPLPMLAQKSGRIQEALMFMSGKSGIATCKELQETPALMQLDYFDRFCRNRLAVRHHIVLTSEGNVEPLDAENIPNDLHEVIGQRLPEELYYYLSVGVIGSRLLNNLTADQIHETVPADGGNSDEYKRLVQEKLLPIRQTTLALLTSSLHRYYQFKQFTHKFWFDETVEETFKPGDTSTIVSSARSWKVPADVTRTSSIPILTSDKKPSLRFAILTLKDSAFAAKTVAGKGSKVSLSAFIFFNTWLMDCKLLQTSEEVTTNVIWRFLHLREYVNDKHELTKWGKVLGAILEAFGVECSSELEQAAILATELLRLDLLNSRVLHPRYSRQAIFGNGISRTGVLKDIQTSNLLTPICRH